LRLDGTFVAAIEKGARADAMSSPHDILTAYSEGRISASEAIKRLNLDGARDLLIAVADAGYRLPQPSPEELKAQVAAALPILRQALRVNGMSHA